MSQISNDELHEFYTPQAPFVRGLKLGVFCLLILMVFYVENSCSFTQSFLPAALMTILFNNLPTSNYHR